jgi:predicted lactoylglutathione lyase
MKKIFINLPVEDLDKSMKFYAQLGFTNQALFTGENQKCMVWSEHIYVMLQSKAFFNSNSKKNLVDSKKNIASSFTLPVDSKELLNKIIENGLNSGGTEPTPLIDEGFMQVRTIEDIDGHTWGIIYLDEIKYEEIKGNISIQNI